MDVLVQLDDFSRVGLLLVLLLLVLQVVLVDGNDLLVQALDHLFADPV